MRAISNSKAASVGLVLCMIIASTAVLFTAAPAAAEFYQSPSGYVEGNETNQNLGRSIALMDLNQDGIADLVVGAPYTSAGGLKDAGAVTVYMSDSGTPMSNVLVINGTATEDLFGLCVADVGDVNGDGMDDIAIGSPWADPAGQSDAGSITLMYGWAGFDGTPNATIAGTVVGEELGFSIARAGDVNGDGMDDILAGAPYYSSGALTYAGRAYVFYGGDPPNSAPDKTFTGDASGAYLGWSISGGGSFDADADLDMVAGAPGRGASGTAYIIRDLSRMNPTVNMVTGPSADENFSFSVSMIHDFDADTITDIAIGAPTNNDNGSRAGAVYVLYGGVKFNDDPDLILHGAPQEWFGWSVTSGDFKEDGVSDLLVGAPNSRLNTSLFGRAYAYYGGLVPASSPNITLVPDAGASFFGASLATGANATGDPAPDFAVGDPLFNVPGFPNAGRVYLYAGVHVIVPANPIVKGYVYVPGTTVGIQGFTVTIESPDLYKSTTTSASGYFVMTAIPGTFWLNASKTGYVANSTMITLAMNDDITAPSFYPLKTPVIMGVIRDNVTGSLLQNAAVALYAGSTYIDGMTTGANGTYWFAVPDDLVPAEGATVTLTVKAWGAARYTSSADVTIGRNETRWQNLSLDRFPVVSGSVREALFLSAVRGAVVQANQGENILATTTTDIRGQYSLMATNATSGVPLFVNVTAAGYFRTNLSAVVMKNGTYSLNFTLQPDNAPPISQLDALAVYSTTPTVPITATASDVNGIMEVQLWYRLSGSGSFEKYGADGTDPYGFAFDASSASGDGVYEFYSIAVDFASNAEAAPAGNDTWTFADSHAPSINIISPFEGSAMDTSDFIALWTGSDSGSGVAKYEVQMDSAGWIDKGLIALHSFTLVADGPHVVSVRATDVAGLSAVKVANFTVDTTGATSSVDALPAYTGYPVFNVTVTATDATGIEEVQLWYRHGGSGSYVYLGSDDTAPYSFEFDALAHEGDGLYEFYSLAIDGAGNNETPPLTADAHVGIDLAPPSVTITSPLMNHTVGNSTVQVNWTAVDPASGIASCEVRIDGGSWVDVGVAQEHSFDSVADGNHTVDVRAYDHLGFNATTYSNFSVDTVAPTVSISYPSNGTALSSTVITLRWAASDVGSGIETLEVSKDGMSWTEVAASSVEYVFTGTSGLSEGDYILYVRAVDRGGLSATSSVDMMLDSTPPSVTISKPIVGQTIKKSNATIGWVMADAVSGVAMVRISVDGGAFQNIGVVRSYDVSGLEDGEHTVTVRVSDGAGNTKDVSVSFTVSTEAGISGVTLGAIALVVIVAVIAAVLLMRRKKPVAAEPPKKEGKS